MECKEYEKYVSILKAELVPAMGCTEPIAVAFAAANAREVLGKMPDKVSVEVSGNIVKNAKSVVVPNTGGRRGLEAAVGIGIIAGDASKQLQVISEVSEEQMDRLGAFLEEPGVSVGIAESNLSIDVRVHLAAGSDNVNLRLAEDHNKIVYIEKNGDILFECPVSEGTEQSCLLDMSIDGIFEFSNICDISDVYEVISRQIEYNSAISDEGLKNNWGANIGSTILKYSNGSLPEVMGKAKAAAGSDARMGGCEMPVVINSGSGNQGLTVSLPVIEYAKYLRCSEEKLFRSLVFANLAGIHIKASVGRLSAYCGAISAGCAAVAGIAYMTGADLNQISHLIVNCLATTSGIVCDGAKPSCAAKIATALDAAILAWNMTKNDQQFLDGDGFVKKGVENTINAVSRIAKDGMAETDKTILKIMTDL